MKEIRGLKSSFVYKKIKTGLNRFYFLEGGICLSRTVFDFYKYFSDSLKVGQNG